RRGYILIRGHMGWLQNKFEKNFLITTVDYVFNWARKSAVWPMTFGLACCAIEMIASSTARFDIARFGSEVFRPSPRQSDLMIVAGTVTLKMAPVVKRIYDQMPDPKWVISMGACSSVGGPFNTYAVLQGVDKIVPTDVYVIGCPPRPENLFYALLKLQDKIDQMSLAKRPTEVRLDESMVEKFKRQVMIAQTLQPKRGDAGAGVLTCPAEQARPVLKDSARPFIKLTAQSDLPPEGEAKECTVGERVICVANVNGTISAMDNVCLHRGGPLGQGVIEGDKLVCPWHGWQYDPKTGQDVHNRTARVVDYAIILVNDDVM